MTVKVVLPSSFFAQILIGPEGRAIVDERAAAVAADVSSSIAGRWPAGTLRVETRSTTTDRSKTIVALVGQPADRVEAKYGVVSSATSAAGLRIVGEP